jgi:hypothetical protein
MYLYPGTMAWLAFDLQRRADGLCALAHDGQAELVCLGRLRVKAAAIVAYVQPHLSGLALQTELGLTGPSMFGYVVERLLRNAVESDMYVIWHSTVAHEGCRYRHARPAHHGIGQLAE